MAAVVADGMGGSAPRSELRADRARHRQHRVPVLRRHRRDRRARAHRDEHPRRRALAARRGDARDLHPRVHDRARAARRRTCRWPRSRRCSIIVARNMSEARHFFRLARIAPRHDVIVMLTCFVLTVVFDMVIAVTVGVVLAALLFMRRMSVLTKAELETPQRAQDRRAAPASASTRSPARCSSARRRPRWRRCTPSATRTTRTSSTCATCRRWTRPASSRSSPCSIACTARRSRSSSPASHRRSATCSTRAGIKRELGKIAYAPDVETAVSMAIVHAARVGKAAASSSMRIPKAGVESETSA